MAIFGWFYLTAYNSAVASEKEVFLEPTMSHIDILFAVAHGIFRATVKINKFELLGSELQIEYCDNNTNQCRLILNPGKKILLDFCCSSSFAVCNLGGFVRKINCDEDISDFSRALLIKIGYGPQELPSSLFYDVIYVDDRPTRGGGLPDFWEATIARVIATISENPNISAVFIMGHQEYADKTVKKLLSVDNWTVEASQISSRTGMSVDAIKAVSDKLKEKVYMFKGSELVHHLTKLLREPYCFQKLNKKTSAQQKKRFLSRDMKLDGMALDKLDGCRVRTAAEAFPVVLEILRKAPDDYIVWDQAKMKLRELIDFKVHLTDPLNGKIPEFREQDAALFVEYFNREFINPCGLFASEFQKGPSQLSAVIKHLTTVIQDQKNQYGTRRGILVVPHSPNGDDLAPLGLVSVRVFPRFTEERVTLHYSFTWRTVEVLVGFPYSLYGSICFSEYITNLIRSNLGSQNENKVTMGTVTYIAHSLHMSLDNYAQNIARSIIDDACN